jgi:hypothetical protein
MNQRSGYFAAGLTHAINNRFIVSIPLAESSEKAEPADTVGIVDRGYDAVILIRCQSDWHWESGVNPIGGCNEHNDGNARLG